MKYLLLAIIIIIVVGVIVMGTQIYGYSSLKTDFSATDVSPKFKINTISIVTGLLSVFQSNLLGAVSTFIQGLQVNGTLTLKNGSFLPLYLASGRRQLLLPVNDNYICRFPSFLFWSFLLSGLRCWAAAVR